MRGKDHGDCDSPTSQDETLDKKKKRKKERPKKPTQKMREKREGARLLSFFDTCASK